MTPIQEVAALSIELRALQQVEEKLHVRMREIYARASELGGQGVPTARLICDAIDSYLAISEHWIDAAFENIERFKGTEKP